jgi:hypothetical protein
MSKRNRPLSKKQRRGLQDLLDQVAAVREKAIHHTGKGPEKEQTHDTINHQG